MNFLNDMVLSLSRLVTQHLETIAAALSATFFFIYGGTIHGLLRKSMQKYHFLVRLVVFTLLCAFVYGLLTVYTAVLLEKILACLGPLYLAPIVIGLFLLIGFLAERKKQM